MNAQQIPGQDPAAVPAKTTNVNVYEQPAAATVASSGVNVQTIAIIAVVVIAVIVLINMIS